MNTEMQVYAIYLTAAAGDRPTGYVVNNIQAPSADAITLVSGQASVVDQDRTYPIGSIYAGVTS